VREYRYTAINKSGAEKRGALTADSVKDAAAELKRNGLTPLKITEVSAFARSISSGSFLQKKPTARDLSVFCRQFVSVLDAGVPMVSALSMLAEQSENKMLSRILTETRIGVEKGESLARSMSPYHRIFGGRMFIALITAGEESGSLGVSLSRMGEQYEKDMKLKGLIKKASIYPIVILIVLVAVVAIMLTLVVPSFVGMFAEMGSELPAITEFVVATSAFMQEKWYLVLLGCAAVGAALSAFGRSNAGKRLYSILVLRIPVAGKLVVKTASARTTRTLATMLSSGIPLITALEITANTMTNVLFRDAVTSASGEVSLGTPLSDSLKRSRRFPPLVHQMCAIGEESGRNDEMLGKVADYYDQEVEATTQQVLALLEPAIIVVMATVVGFIVLSIMLPIISMFGALDRI
jgi:type IV pilus assembly protein PilC